MTEYERIVWKFVSDIDYDHGKYLNPETSEEPEAGMKQLTKLTDSLLYDLRDIQGVVIPEVDA